MRIVFVYYHLDFSYIFRLDLRNYLILEKNKWVENDRKKIEELTPN